MQHPSRGKGSQHSVFRDSTNAEWQISKQMDWKLQE
jgi:hypothetical protein